MIYIARCLMGGFTLRQSWELWKYKLQLFNPTTWHVLNIIWLWLDIQRMKVADFFNKYNKGK